jgi:hypothetical protein
MISWLSARREIWLRHWHWRNTIKLLTIAPAVLALALGANKWWIVATVGLAFLGFIADNLILMLWFREYRLRRPQDFPRINRYIFAAFVLTLGALVVLVLYSGLTGRL